jgi:hypothetical protein
MIESLFDSAILRASNSQACFEARFTVSDPLNRKPLNCVSVFATAMPGQVAGQEKQKEKRGKREKGKGRGQ